MFKFLEDLIIFRKFDQFNENVHKRDLLLKFLYIKLFSEFVEDNLFNLIEKFFKRDHE